MGQNILGPYNKAHDTYTCIRLCYDYAVNGCLIAVQAAAYMLLQPS